MVLCNIEKAMQLEFHVREASSIDLLGGACSYLPVFWLLRMMLKVAAGIGSVMHLSSSSCRLSLDVRIADAAMVNCLKGCLIFHCADEMASNILTSLVIRRCRINCVW